MPLLVEHEWVDEGSFADEQQHVELKLQLWVVPKLVGVGAVPLLFPIVAVAVPLPMAVQLLRVGQADDIQQQLPLPRLRLHRQSYLQKEVRKHDEKDNMRFYNSNSIVKHATLSSFRNSNYARAASSSSSSKNCNVLFMRSANSSASLLGAALTRLLSRVPSTATDTYKK